MASVQESKRIKTEEAKTHHPVDSSDDDEDYDEIIHDPPPREITDAELADYYKQVASSKGFEVQRFEGSIAGGVSPCNINEKNEKLLSDLSKLALQDYNEKNDADFKFDRLVRATHQCVTGRLYYITFDAHSNDESRTFRGKVWYKLFGQEPEVQFCEKI